MPKQRSSKELSRNEFIWSSLVDRCCRSSAQGGKFTSTEGSSRRITSRSWTTISASHHHWFPGTRPSIISASVQPSNIIVSNKLSDSNNLHIVGLIDWQHTSILPLFLLAGIPQGLQNYDDIGAQSMTRPLLPENLGSLDETQQNKELELYHRRLVHYHYVKNTEQYNEPHYAALTESMGMFRRRLFSYASEPWEGESLALKVALIQATSNWKTLTEGDTPCLVVFDPDDIRETLCLDAEQREVEETLEMCQDVIGHGPEGWVPVEHYEEAMACSRKLKEDALAKAELEAELEAESEEERVLIAAHWPFDDMDEEEYM